MASFGSRGWHARRSASFRCSCSAYLLFASGRAERTAAAGLGKTCRIRGRRAWGARLGWVDPITLAIKDGLPFTSRVSRAFIALRPGALAGGWPGVMVVRANHEPAASWLRAVTGLILLVTIETNAVGRSARDDRQGWLVLAALLLVGGIVGPDSFGAAHGEFLPQRVVLLGFIALVPVFDVDRSRWSGRARRGGDRGRGRALNQRSSGTTDSIPIATAGQIIRAGDLVGRDQRIVTLLVTSQGRFRANPLLHAENWLGVDTGNVVWNNYEALHYYFPVQFRPEIERPHPGRPGAGLDPRRPEGQGEPPCVTGRRSWPSHADSIDVILFWKSDPELEAITKRWFDLKRANGATCRSFERIRQRRS